jgi:hypothetical protein
MKNFNHSRFQEEIKNLSKFFTYKMISASAWIDSATFYNYTVGRRSPTPEQLSRIINIFNDCRAAISVMKHIKTGFMTVPLHELTENDFLN